MRSAPSHSPNRRKTARFTRRFSRTIESPTLLSVAVEIIALTMLETKDPLGKRAKDPLLWVCHTVLIQARRTSKETALISMRARTPTTIKMSSPRS